jgi:nucleotide-binding universal stress UspA family protein
MVRATRNPVVVGVDGSASALHAVRWAAEQAVRRGLPLRIVHVYVAPITLPGGVVDPSIVRGAMRTQGSRWLSEARTAAQEVAPTLEPDLALENAPLIPVLAKESGSAELLVLGTRGLGGFTGLLLGSTATLLAGRAHCPLVVVRGDDTGTVREHGPVVVGVDGTRNSEQAIAFAFAEASARDGRLVAVHTWTDSVADTALLGHPEPPDFEPAQQQAFELLAERLAGWQEKYPDVHVTREVVRDHPSRALLRYAAGAALVVVGTRGRGGFRGLVLGSTGQHLLHHAPCPVAIVRTEVDGQEE